jgi:L-fuculose-phosphate aldolase
MGRSRTARAIVRTARAMATQGLVIGTVGNVSARTGAGFTITPTRLAYPRMHARDLVSLDGEGRVLRGRRPPSREWRMHAQIYRARPDVQAIVHTHSLHATAWSFLGEHWLPALEELEYYGLGRIRVSRAAPSGSPELARNATAALGDAGGVLLGAHGAVAVGADLDEALVRAAVLERQAAVACLLRSASGRVSSHSAA